MPPGLIEVPAAQRSADVFFVHSCDAGLLRVAIPSSERRGFANVLTFSGSYRVFDYNLFYTKIHLNAAERVAAYHASLRAAP